MCVCLHERANEYFSVCLSVCLLNRKLIKKEEHANDFEVCIAACIIKYNGGAGGKHVFHNKNDDDHVYYIHLSIHIEIETSWE